MHGAWISQLVNASKGELDQQATFNSSATMATSPSVSAGQSLPIPAPLAGRGGQSSSNGGNNTQAGSFPPQNAPLPALPTTRRASEAPGLLPLPHEQQINPTTVKHRHRAWPKDDRLAVAAQAASKIGPQRTTKNVQKLKILPFPDQQDEESGREVYSQVTRIKDTTARRDAERLGKAERAHLPRVTAYCTANAYKIEGLLRYLKARAETRGAAPKQFDECIYTPYSYSLAEGLHLHEDREEDTFNDPDLERSASMHSGSSLVHETTTESTIVPEQDGDSDDDDRRSVLSLVKSQPTTRSEVFLFNYGVVVIWGMTLAEEKRFLKEIARFETEKLSDDDVQVENFNFYITNSYQPRIYNDFITLKDGRNYMVKVAISHAIAQSVKVDRSQGFSVFQPTIARISHLCFHFALDLSFRGPR